MIINSFRSPRLAPVVVAALTALVVTCLALPGAVDAAPAPAWQVDGFTTPSVLSSAQNAECLATIERTKPALRLCDTYVVTVTDVGASQFGLGPVTISDTLPENVTIQRVVLFWNEAGEGVETDLVEKFGDCATASNTINCVIPASFFSSTIGRTVQPDDTIKLLANVTVTQPPAPTTVTSTVSVLGNGAAEVTKTFESRISEEQPQFGLASFTSMATEEEGAPSTVAASHPYELDTKLDFNTQIEQGPDGSVEASSVDSPRDIVVDLPVGFAGSALSASRCTLAELGTQNTADEQGTSGCPEESIVGHIRTGPPGLVSANSPIYNLVPEHGVAAEFGYIDATGGTHVLYARLTPTPAGYVLRTLAREVPEINLSEVTVTFYGDPAQRDGGLGTHVPTFTMPSLCDGSEGVTAIHMDSWSKPAHFDENDEPDLSDPNWVTSTSGTPAVTGCSALQFLPELEAQAESSQVDTPSGLNVNVSLPQSSGVEAPATPPLRDTTVTLPEGFVVNPASANGLASCSLAQVGVSPAGQPNAAPPQCPDASKIGVVELETPALPGILHGAIYVAQPTENPFHTLLALYIVIDDPTTGVIVKLPAEVQPDPLTGQLTTKVDDSPQFPFSQLRTHFFGGPQAALRTPLVCGSYRVTGKLTPWSAPASGGPRSVSSHPVKISSAAAGECPEAPEAEANSPSFDAGTTTPTAGAYSPLVVHLARADDSQNFSAISVTLPPGATGKLAGIPQCSNAQIVTAEARRNIGEGALEAANPSCPASSQIGTVTVGAGAGPNPFYVTGNAYLAGPYKGAPFSMAIMTPAVAGPFDLGVVVVRAGLYINPVTAQVTAKSDPIPAILQGIPLDVRSVAVNVDRPGFTLNPTSCNPLTVTGEETSTQGHVAPLADHFQAGSCQGLKFKPDLTASTAGKASKAGGAALDVKVAYPSAPFTGYANIRSVKVSLPKQLPSRLTTLQKACLAATFEANPASCPTASDVGTATASTPLLSSPLVGPAFIVSHGNEAFPDLEIVLQGENITLVLDGNTQIKNGITSSTFKAVPDAPVSSFELKLPTGKFSILGANVPQSAKYSLCGQNLTMPTEITAQNGALINQTTKIAITGCAKAKALTRSQKLAKALKACHKDKRKAKRAKCERQARKRYGPAERATKKTKKKPATKK